MKHNKINIEMALLDPTSIFKTPSEVVDNNSLTKEQKLAILKRWEYDAKELEIADDENMVAQNNGADILDDILHAIDLLNNQNTL